MSPYQAIVIGAGPGGLATISSLLDAGLNTILWVDRKFGGGRLNKMYREISSNTKVGIYLDAIYSSTTCTAIINSTAKPNAVTRLEELDREDTCELSLAGDMVMMLIHGIMTLDEVETHQNDVTEARLEGDTWTISTTTSTTSTRFDTKRLFLCTGSHPKTPTFHQPFNPNLIVLDLDECLIKSHLPSLFPSSGGHKSIIAVIGNSHSGVLVCRNLYEVADSGLCDLEVLNFCRSPIRFAEYREDGIVFDNTGLKGATADWAKTTMAHPDALILSQIDLSSDNEDEIYTTHLPTCTHIIYAIGYDPSPLPHIYKDDRRLDGRLAYDMHTSGFRIGGEGGELVKGLYGAGIAFPEETADPEGHVEAAVGVAKFFRFGERVKGDWQAVKG